MNCWRLLSEKQRDSVVRRSKIRNANNYEAVVRRDSADFREGPENLLKVFKNLITDDNVERAVRKRKPVSFKIDGVDLNSLSLEQFHRNRKGFYCA